jgi:hypothetical protein
VGKCWTICKGRRSSNWAAFTGLVLCRVIRSRAPFRFLHSSLPPVVKVCTAAVDRQESRDARERQERKQSNQPQIHAGIIGPRARHLQFQPVCVVAKPENGPQGLPPPPEEGGFNLGNYPTVQRPENKCQVPSTLDLSRWVVPEMSRGVRRTREEVRLSGDAHKMMIWLWIHISAIT